MNLIIPAAGQSSRFPNMRPKWLLTHPSGNLMIAEAISGLKIPNLQRIYLTVLASHMEKFGCREGIMQQYDRIGLGNKLTIVELDQETKSQPETVARTIEQENIKGRFFIKDSDNYFCLNVPNGNFVSVVDLNTVSSINPSNKSYASINENHLITNIVEKRVISNYFCSGAYGFEDPEEFLKYYHQLSGLDNLYISHIVYQMILEDKAFTAIPCTSYSDWGTIKDWNTFKSQFGTVFTDLDGVLVLNSAEYFSPIWGETDGIEENITVLNKLYDSGKVQIIVTTSRTEAFRDVTIKQLGKLGVKYHQIIFGLNHGKRLIINDYARSNPYKSCEAINIARNTSQLAEMLEAVMPVD